VSVTSISASYPAGMIILIVAEQVSKIETQSFSIMDFLLGEILEWVMAWGSALFFS
jgi:hypothetical protein